MALPFRTALVTALVTGLSGLCLFSQAPETFGASLKVRAGITAGNVQTDTHANGVLGVGAGFFYSLTKTSSIIGELTYSQFASRPFANPITLPANAALSGDMRKNRLSGFSARVGYRDAIGQTKYSWQAGLVIDRLKSRQEASGQLAVGTTIGTAVIESIAVSTESTKIRPGVFAGLHSNLSEEVSLECNLFTVGYSQVNWMPQTYSGQPAAPVTANRTGFALEVALGLRF